jgi:hypothetical protein
MATYIHSILELYDTDHKATIKVCEDGDGIGLIEVVCTDPEIYGPIDFRMDVKTAVALARTILKQAENMGFSA